MSVPEASQSNLRKLSVELVCEYLLIHVPAGESFGFGQVLLTVPNRNRAREVLGKLISAGVVKHVAFGKYTHTGHCPENWADVTHLAMTGREWRPKIRMQQYVSQHFLPGQVFTPQDLVVFGSKERVKISLVKLRKAGFLIADGFGAYAVPRKSGKQVWPERVNLQAPVRADVQRMPAGETFGPRDFGHLGSAAKVAPVLVLLAKAGKIVRVSPALYVRAGDPAVKEHVPLAVRVRERIEELPTGTTFTRHSELFDDLGSRPGVVQALASMVHRGELSRVAWGTYALNDTGGLPTPFPPWRDQVRRRIEELVPDGGEFTLRSLNFTGPSRVPGNVLPDFARDGVIARVSHGVYVRVFPPGRDVPGAGASGRSHGEAGVTTI